MFRTAVALFTATVLKAALAEVSCTDHTSLYQQTVAVTHQRVEVDGALTDTAHVGPLDHGKDARGFPLTTENRKAFQPAVVQTKLASRPSTPSVSDVCFLMLSAAYSVGSSGHAANVLDDLTESINDGEEAFNLSTGLTVNMNHTTIPMGARLDWANSTERMHHTWQHDVFPDKHHTTHTNGDEGFNFFRSAPVEDWIILIVAAVFLCLLDWFVLRQCPETFAWHMAIVCQWIVWALVFNGIVWARQGPHAAFEWATGYLLEWMLSMDNLFVFHLVFRSYKTPSNQIHKAVFIGVVGAVLMRMLFFMVVSTLLRLFSWFRWPFGALLIWSGIEAARSEDDDDEDVSDTRLIRGLKWILGDRLLEEYDTEGEACIVVDKKTGKYQVTILVIVICCLEFTDILFALDSVSAKVAQIPDQYIAFTSSVIAMYGLRAMFFIIKDLVEMFDLLKYGLCLILIFIGVELMFSHYMHLASSTVCVMIIGVFVVCIIGSQAMKRLRARRTSSQLNLAEADTEKQTIDKLVVKTSSKDSSA